MDQSFVYLNALGVIFFMGNKLRFFSPTNLPALPIMLWDCNGVMMFEQLLAGNYQKTL